MKTNSPINMFNTSSNVWLLFIFMLFSSIIAKAQSDLYTVIYENETYGMDIRSENSFLPDKEKHIRGLNNILITREGNHLKLSLSDSLFVNDNLPFLSVGVEDGKESYMPISAIRLSTGQEFSLNIPMLIGDKDYVRVVIWINNIGENDAKRVIEIRRKSSSATTQDIEAVDNFQSDLVNQKASIKGFDNIKVSLKENELLLSVNDTLFANNGGSLLLSVFVVTKQNSNMPIASLKISDPEISLDLDILMQDIVSANFIVWLYDYNGNGIKRIISVLRNDNSKTFTISS